MALNSEQQKNQCYEGEEVKRRDGKKQDGEGHC